MSIIRIPSPSQHAGVGAIERLVYDLDGAYTTADTQRTAALRRPRAHISDASVTPTRNTLTVITGYLAVDYDLDGMADLVSSNDRLTCHTAGTYLATLTITFDITAGSPSAGMWWRAGIRRNNATVPPDYRARRWLTPQFDSPDLTTVAVIPLAAGDTLTSDLIWNDTDATDAAATCHLGAVMICANP